MGRFNGWDVHRVSLGDRLQHLDPAASGQLKSACYNPAAAGGTRVANWRGCVVWSNARAWRAREPKGSVGSNPTLSAFDSRAGFGLVAASDISCSLSVRKHR